VQISRGKNLFDDVLAKTISQRHLHLDSKDDLQHPSKLDDKVYLIFRLTVGERSDPKASLSWELM
jgi:hypothetical protein